MRQEELEEERMATRRMASNCMKRRGGELGDEASAERREGGELEEEMRRRSARRECEKEVGKWPPETLKPLSTLPKAPRPQTSRPPATWP